MWRRFGVVRSRVLGLCFGLEAPSPVNIAQSIQSRDFKSGPRCAEVQKVL